MKELLREKYDSNLGIKLKMYQQKKVSNMELFQAYRDQLILKVLNCQYMRTYV